MHFYGIAPCVWGIAFHMALMGGDAVKAKVMPDGRVSLPAELRKKHGLAQGGEVIVEDAGDAIVLRTVDQVVARAQALSRKLVAGKTGASVDDFLAGRARDAEAE
jgi:AbrB family looped-hinge helix DNA binding protein